MIGADYYRRRDDLVEMASYIARKRESLVPAGGRSRPRPGGAHP